jgi:hypothetical protein
MSKPDPVPAPAPAPAPQPDQPSKLRFDSPNMPTGIPFMGGQLKPMRKGIKFEKKFAKGGKIDGCAQRGKTKCKVV